MDLADLTGPERRPGMDHAVENDRRREPGADRDEQCRVGCRTAAPNVASATAALRTSWPTVTGRP